MIGPDDIRAFEEHEAANLDAMGEYHRRMMKGLPSDRFTDGAAGAIRVGRGIGAMTAINAALWAIVLRKTDDATHPHKDPMRPETTR